MKRRRQTDRDLLPLVGILQEMVRPSDGARSGGLGGVPLAFLGSEFEVELILPDMPEFESVTGDEVWVPSGASEEVAGFEIGGMVYVGSGLRTGGGWEIENCLIEPSLPVAAAGHKGIPHPYVPLRPSYAGLDPAMRRNFLRWLASDRSDPDLELECLLVYFFGLERRLFVDEPPADERCALLAEVQRLQAIYGKSGRFERYCRKVLDAAAVWEPPGSEPTPQEVLAARGEFPLRLQLALGRKAAARERLGANLMACWWLAHPAVRLRAAQRRVVDEFAALFAARFERKYPRGLKVTEPKRRLRYTYRSASLHFNRDFSRELAECPDMAALSKPIKIAAEIAETCWPELSAYSQCVGRGGGEQASAEAYLLLPDELARLPHAGLEAFGNWAGQLLAERGGWAKVEDLLARFGGKPAVSVQTKKLRSAADALARVGFGLAPDPWVPGLALEAGDEVLLFPLPERSRRSREPVLDYLAAFAALRVGAWVACRDGGSSPAKERMLKAFVASASGLEPAAVAALEAEFKWMLARPPEVGALKKLLGDLERGAQGAVADLALAVASADGSVGPEGVKALQKVLRAMNLPEDDLLGELHRRMTAPPTEPVTVFRPAGTRSGHPLPKRFSAAARGAGGPVELDRERISAIAADTQRVAAVLSNVFADEAPETEAENAEPPAAAQPTAYLGLDEPHSALVAELLTRPCWSESEFASLVQRCGLMAGGALEAVNEWAYDRYGDALLEEDLDLKLNTELVEALRRESLGASSGTSRH